MNSIRSKKNGTFTFRVYVSSELIEFLWEGRDEMTGEPVTFAQFMDVDAVESIRKDFARAVAALKSAKQARQGGH